MEHVCLKCGHDCEIKVNSVSRMEMGVHVSIEETAADFERIKEMFGRTEFCLCWCCWLKALGFPIMENEK